jgi:hypothetical protein
MDRNNRMPSINFLAFKQRAWSDVTRVKSAMFVTFCVMYVAAIMNYLMQGKHFVRAE